MRFARRIEANICTPTRLVGATRQMAAHGRATLHKGGGVLYMAAATLLDDERAILSSKPLDQAHGEEMSAID